MPGPKRSLPVEVVERAEALTKRYTIAPGSTKHVPPKQVLNLPAAAKKKKLVLALKKLHPMD